ncbi:centromere-associated protein E isoform X10 [Apis mellifera]|uniref:Centromere-associated protein E isoform X10 n=1 Tax=Apis mellifera TaxID=7460 RepID=A0A7M7SPH1_APIME|nr:centromere-associated protein E isoform X10 [Apis mellifera]|eukprot:XP_026297829.1 centromere-associated protein E isoform X10 [Apis mellifera]
MSKAIEDDERRRRSLEAGREILEKYKAEKASKVQGTSYNQMDEISDEESFRNDKSIGHRESYVHEGVSSRDVTQSSVSMSEGEADGDLEGLAGRVAQLEELLQGKEAIVEALNAEIDHLRAEASSPNSSQSQNSSIPSRDVIPLYHTKLQEFEKAVNQRDNLIEELMWSLQQAISARDNFASQLNALNAMEIPCKDNTSSMNNKSLQEKIDTLEKTLNDQRSMIQKLNSQLAQNLEHVQTLEMERETRVAEINDYKLQINNLNEQIRVSAADKNLNITETLEQQKQYEARVDKIKQDMQHILKKFTTETNINTTRHQQELKDLATKHEKEIINIQDKYEEEIKQLKEENKILADRLNKELPDLDTRHAKELSIFQTQLTHYKKTVEALKLELMNRSESQQIAQTELNEYKSKFNEFKVQSERARHILNLENQKEKEMLSEQIKLHKLQLEEITSKYIAVTAILESKESIERSLEQALSNAAMLKEENESLKFKLDDLSSRYSAAQSLIENSQTHEKTLSNRIYDLEKSLSRLSGINMSTLSELNETTYQTFDEVAVQYQLTKQKLEEKAELEKLLIQRIEGLEEDIRKSKEELEQTDLIKKSYEKQLKDMKNVCDKYKSELISLKKNELDDQSSLLLEEELKLSNQNMKDTVNDLLHKIEEDQQEIKKFKIILEQKETEFAECIKKMYDLTDKLKKSEQEREQLKNGLATAWAQCAEVEEKLNQTLALNDSKLDISVPSSSYNSALMKQYKLDRIVDDSVSMMHDQSLDKNKTLSEKNENLDSSNKRVSLQGKLTFVLEENERLRKELEHLNQQTDYEEIKSKLKYYISLSENLTTEKEQKMEENRVLKKKLDNLYLLKESINQLRSEKETLRKEIETLIHVHDEQINAIKTETTSEIRKVQSLMLGLKEGTTELNDLKIELEKRHAKEMEELRMYFEQKCLLMEKQYSEEIFSQQSKKMSDNDSEIADITEDLYFGGAGDCLNVSNISEHNSRLGSPIGDEQSKYSSKNFNTYNKSELEYEIKTLQQELQNKIIEGQEMKLNYEKALEDQKNIYEKELYNNKERKHGFLRNMVNQHCQTEWDAGALENGELTQLRAAYNHQLEEQVALAKLDIINALQEQIQVLLTIESDVEDNWPIELLELRDKLTGNAKKEMQLLKNTHIEEVQHLKEEHSRTVTKMIDCHREELNKIKSEYLQNYCGDRSLLIDNKIFEERNNLTKTCTTLKTLIEELIKYFIVCEEEINNTLFTEITKKQLSDSVNNEKTMQFDETEGLKCNELKMSSKKDSLNLSEMIVRKVHFAPKTTEIVSIINSNVETLPTILEEDDNITEKLKQELNNCILRLKSESAEILNTSSIEGKLSSKDTFWLNKMNEELNLKLHHAETLIMGYQEEIDHQKMTIFDLQRKLVNAENKKETITEGYGENYDVGIDTTLQDFSQLQEKVRHVLSNGGGDCTELLQLIDELSRQSDKLMEEAKKEKEDLQQQIEAADKQLKATRKFLDEQASEREAERDEAAKQIHILQEQLKEREREKERDQRITSEVEVLESQMREMSSLMSDTEAKKNETESELKAAIDKIWVLREIITDLEQQLQIKTEKEESLQLQINQLETVIAAQTKNQHELVQELDAVKMGSESKQLNEHIIHLQEELRKHKLSSEQFNVNSAALKQMKTELRDMQNQLDKRIKELESAHMCSSNLSLSQPSEDVSIRDQIDATRCPTPDDPTAPPMLPLDQLLKLKEKMLKHARAEEVAFKRIKDLELQVTALRNQNEELQAEQEILQQTASEQLFQIQSMRGRLEQHKQSAPFAQRQATSRLELQLHEANTKFQSLERTIADKDLELKDMKNQLDRINQLLQEKQAEIANVVQVESVTIQKLKEHLEVVEEEKKILQAKVGVQEHAQLELPKLIDSMLADKNEEIDHLKEQLSKKEKQLEMYSSLNLDETQLRELARQTEAKNSARTLSDILSIHSECEETAEAIRGINTTQNLPNVSTFKVPFTLKNIDDSIVPLMDSAKMIHPQVPPLDLGSQSLSATSSQQSGMLDLLHSGLELKTSSSENNLSNDKTDHVTQSRQERQKSPEKHIDEKNDSNKSCVTSIKYTQTSINETLNEMEKLENQLQIMKEELNTKSAILNKKENDLITLQKHYDELQTEFKEVIETLSRDKYFYQNQYELSRVSENKIKKDLQEIENVLKLKDEEIQDHKNKMQMNERIIMELNSENIKLKKNIEEKEQELEQTRKYTTLLHEKIKEVQNFRDIILDKDITIETIQTRNIEIENENKQLYEFKTKYQSIKQELLECQTEIQRLTEGLNNRDQIIRRLEEMARRTSVSETSSPSNEKDQEIHHLQEYLKEKDKMIRQMNDDGKNLHKALEIIQNKMKESGNVVELRKKLKDEKKLTAELRDMVDKMSKELSDLKLIAQRSQDDTDIEDMVQRELNLSVHLDKQIMNAIESDTKTHKTECEKQHNSAPYQDMELKLKLIQANKINEELKKLKDDLEIEREMLKCQIAEYENRIFQLKSDLTEESKKVVKLDDELSSEKKLMRMLKIEIEKEHRTMQIEHIRNSELIDFLQNKQKNSLDNEAKLKNELNLLRQEYKNLEMQLSLMKEHVQSQKADDLPKLTDLLENERKKYLLLMENFEKEEKNNVELKDTLKKLQIEKNRIEKQLEVEEEKKENLISNLILIEGTKDHLQTDLRRTKEELKAKEEECEWLQKRIKTMSDAETRRQERSTSEHNDLKASRREINNAREVIMDLEADMKQLKRELTESLEREVKLTETMETLKERESDLIKKLTTAKDEEKNLKDVITELQQDIKTYTIRELELTKELKNRFSNENVPAKFLQKIEDLTNINEKYLTEKTILQEKLMKAREEKEQLNQRIKLLESQVKRSKVPQDLNTREHTEKLQHFYGKFLRADSRRKALAYQKRYLLSIVGGYQLSEENTLSVLAQLTKVQRSYAVIGRNKKSPKVRFRSAVLVVISICRMKWLIVRWNTGKRIGVKTLLWNIDQSFLPIQKTAMNHSPPVRDKNTSNGDGGFDGFTLEQYYQRLKNIQQKLGLAMAETGNLQIIPE